jgi:predicted peroxiredoxin
MKKTMEKLGIPPVPEFIEMIYDAGCKLYACKASVDMFKLKKEDFCPPASILRTFAGKLRQLRRPEI